MELTQLSLTYDRKVCDYCGGSLKCIWHPIGHYKACSVTCKKHIEQTIAAEGDECSCVSCRSVEEVVP